MSEHSVALLAGSGIVIYYIALITFLIYLYKMKEFARIEEMRKPEVILDLQ